MEKAIIRVVSLLISVIPETIPPTVITNKNSKVAMILLIIGYLSKKEILLIVYYPPRSPVKFLSQNVFGNSKIQTLAIKNTNASTNLDHFINEFVIR
jgi:hypothetical protein